MATTPFNQNAVINNGALEPLGPPIIPAAPVVKPKSVPVVTSQPARNKVNEIQNVLSQSVVPPKKEEPITLVEPAKEQPKEPVPTYADEAGKALSKQMELDQQAYDNYKSTLDQIYRGDLTPDEKLEIDKLQQYYDQIKEQQKVANRSTEGMAAEFGNRLGLNVGSPLQAQGYVDVAINMGLNRIAQIQGLADEKKAEMKKAFLENKLSVAADAYKAYTELSSRKTEAIKAMNDVQSEYANSLRDYNLKVQEFAADEAYRYKQMEQEDYQFGEELKLKQEDNRMQSRKLAADLYKSDLESQKLRKDLGIGDIANGKIPMNLDLSDPDVIKDLAVSDITKAAMTGTIKLKELTPTDKAKVASEMYNVGFNPNEYIVKKLVHIGDLWNKMPESKRGIVNSLVTPFASNVDASVAEFESAKKVLTREIARLNDVGMLSDQDVADYNDAMPSRRDESFDVVNSKIKGLGAAVAGKSGDVQKSPASNALRKGEILVKDNKTGKTGAILEKEFDSSKYTKL